MIRAAILSVCAAILVGCGTRQKPVVERKGRIITITDTILDAGGTDTVRFGRMRSGEIAVMRFWIENSAARPTAITSYERTCGCTTLEFDAQPIKTGEAQQVSLSFDSRGVWGWQLKALDITLAGASKPLRIFVEADVE